MGRRATSWGARIRTRLQSEVLRSTLAGLLATAIIVPLWSVDIIDHTSASAQGVPTQWNDLLRAAEAAVLMIAWITFAGFYLGMTHIAFSHLPHSALHTVAARQYQRKISLLD